MVHTRVVDADCDLGEYERGHQRTEKPFQLCLKKGDDRQNTARCVEKIAMPDCPGAKWKSRPLLNGAVIIHV
jgi:hypothetical protein